MNKLISQIWYSPGHMEPHPALLACQKSVKELHPDYTYAYWTDKELDSLFSMDYPGNGKVPALTEQELRAFFETLKTCDRSGKATCVQVDLFKLMIVYQFGGFFIDHDMYALQRLDRFLKDPYCFGYVTDYFLVGEHLIGAEPKDKLILGILHSFVRTPIIQRASSMNLSHWCIQFGLLDYVQQPIVTCPHAEWEADKGMNLHKYSEETTFIHCWSSAYRKDQYEFDRLKSIQQSFRKERVTV